ncbi:MAG: histidinol dehydrogenase [Planctomycetota bacterium]
MSTELDRILILPSQPDYKERLSKLREKKGPAGRFAGYDSQGSRQVLEIVRSVSENGDDAVRDYTKRFDGVDLAPDEFRVAKSDLEKAHSRIDKGLLASLRRAIENVRTYQSAIFIGNGKHRGIRYTPIKRVGICVPGASVPMPSTVIMTAVPAIVGGVNAKDIVVVSPPRYKPSAREKGTIHPVTLAVCWELEIENVYRIGGAQAIAALASAKGTIPKVDKIVGPGNLWVQTAKKMVSQDYVGIDSIMGPSEVFIIANAEARPAWVAADMLSQAEHAEDSKAVVATDSETIARQVYEELKDQVAKLPRAVQAQKSLIEFGAIVALNSMSDVLDFANDFAAEHLQIECGARSREVADRIENAGAIFIGDYCPVAVGDYWAGPSHTLPTEMRAKFSSALTSNDFVKSISVIEYDREKLAQCAEDIIRLAETEGLDAHARSVRIRQMDR